jgi:hypothetical protein
MSARYAKYSRYAMFARYVRYASSAKYARYGSSLLEYLHFQLFLNIIPPPIACLQVLHIQKIQVESVALAYPHLDFVPLFLLKKLWMLQPTYNHRLRTVANDSQLCKHTRLLQQTDTDEEVDFHRRMSFNLSYITHSFKISPLSFHTEQVIIASVCLQYLPFVVYFSPLFVSPFLLVS